jgi:hypothetical protein
VNYLKSKGVELKIEKISSDEGEGAKMNHPEKPPSMKNIDIVVASTAGGNYTMDFFTDSNEHWKIQPLYKDLTQQKTLKGKIVNFPQTIAQVLGSSLDYLVVREITPTPKQSGTRLMRYRNGKLQEAIIWKLEDRIYYEGQDLVELQTFSNLEGITRETHTSLVDECFKFARKDNPSTWCTEEKWRTLTAGTWKPDSVVQLAHLYDTDRAGTVNLFPVRGVGYNTNVPGRHAGEDFHEKDAFVGFWGGEVKTKSPIPTAVNGSMPVTLYHYLTNDTPIEGQNGWGYKSLLPDLREERK